MAGLDKYLSQFRDPYERRARLTPGLLVVAPIIVALTCEFGLKHPVLSAAGAVLGACGAMYGLASVVRGRGKELEDKLVKEWGGMPTTIALRHRDKFLDSVSKGRYHGLIEKKLGIRMPSGEEEHENPAKADDIYVGATKRLRELTHSDRGLLFKENIAYGFHRNMLAMKSVGIALSLFGILYGLVQAKILLPTPPHVAPVAIFDPGLSAGVTIMYAAATLLAWVSYFTKSAVRQIGFVYAERLFEKLPSLRVSAQSPRDERGTSA